MLDLASKNFTPRTDGSLPCIYFGDENSKDKLLAENIRIHLGYQAKYSVLFATLLMQEFGYDANQLTIFLKKDTLKNGINLSKNERVNIIRRALQKLQEENLIIYEPKSLPKSNDWIKFLTIEAKDIFKTNEKTLWDEEYFPSYGYLEYNLATNKIFITYKKLKRNTNILDAVIKNNDVLNFKVDGSTFIHFKSYKIDFGKVCSSQNKVDTIKEEIKNLLVDIKHDLNLLAHIIK